MILSGDSLAMTVLGYPDTVSVTMDEMLHHCRAVHRGAQSAFLVGDMPFMSYQVSVEDAVRNAGRFLKEAGMDCVKLEGFHPNTIRAIVTAGIPVVGHLGLTPQTATQLGGFKVQAKTAAAAQQLLQHALALAEAGCFMLVLEAIPASVATLVSERLRIPTIGIGAGAGCDGQVLVFHDLLGLFDNFKPKFVKQYAQLRQPILDAVRTYIAEVQARTFPTDAHCYKMSEADLKILLDG